ncbi:MAG: FAD binding domain-containing protein [Treponema sp.]|jgi:NADPH-dependent glutamate synthase beta subunit-like oxidoreductase|nr:FAD binding domain-containing protein [Treponema sp.]
MKSFEHRNAGSFTEAARLLKDSKGKALPLSGGSDLLGVWKDRILPDYPEMVVNLKTIPGYNRIEEKGGSLVLGAGARLKDVAKLKNWPALSEAAYSVASPLVRTIATVAGNICQDVRCWYYRYPDSIGGAFQCKRKGGETCYAIHGENRYHSVFGGMEVQGSACKNACPAGTKIPEYLACLRKGDWDAAAEVILRVNPMLTSRVCTHLCQDDCNQCVYGESVNIHGVERAVGDYILEHADTFYSAPEKETGKKIAVIGAGPGGLSAAYFLRKAGHTVTVYDRMKKAGGVLQYGIPHYRLPKKYVDAFAAALEKMGVIFRFGVDAGKNISAEQIKAENDSVYFGTGAWKQPVLGLDGEKLTEFGLNFLVEVNTYLEKAIGNDVLVCGGGNVAMDVALTAVRLGAKNVKLVCLEQAHEMPASPEEVERAREEGVQIYNGWGLARVLTGTDGRVSGLEAKKCLSVFDKEGRFSPVYDEKDITVINSGYIILATGQRVDLEFLGDKLAGQIKSPRGLIDADPDSSRTKAPGVYAGGDAVTGPNIAIRAIAAGGAAARSINQDLGITVEKAETPFGFRHFDREGIGVNRAAVLKEVPLGRRTLTLEDSETLPPESAVRKARRCMHCGCYAVNPSDLAPVLLMLEAEIVTTERTISAEDFFTARLNAQDLLRPGELITEIIVPDSEGISHYDKVRVRNAVDFAVISLASRLVMEKGVVKDVRLVFGGVAPVPYRLKNVEQFLTGKTLSPEIVCKAAELALDKTCVMDKNEYKFAAMTSTLKDALIRAEQGGDPPGK